MIREAIADAIRVRGISVNALAAKADVFQSSLQRFLKCNKGLQMDSLERVLAALDLSLCIVMKPAPTPE